MPRLILLVALGLHAAATDPPATDILPTDQGATTKPEAQEPTDVIEVGKLQDSIKAFQSSGPKVRFVSDLTVMVTAWFIFQNMAFATPLGIAFLVTFPVWFPNVDQLDKGLVHSVLRFQFLLMVSVLLIIILYNSTMVLQYQGYLALVGAIGLVTFAHQKSLIPKVLLTLSEPLAKLSLCMYVATSVFKPLIAPTIAPVFLVSAAGLYMLRLPSRADEMIEFPGKVDKKLSDEGTMKFIWKTFGSLAMLNVLALALSVYDIRSVVENPKFSFATSTLLNMGPFKSILEAFLPEGGAWPGQEFVWVLYTGYAISNLGFMTYSAVKRYQENSKSVAPPAHEKKD